MAGNGDTENHQPERHAEPAARTIGSGDHLGEQVAHNQEMHMNDVMQDRIGGGQAVQGA